MINRGPAFLIDVLLLKGVSAQSTGNIAIVFL